MIFYFSGTGNSLYAAKAISECNNEELVSIASEVNFGKVPFEYELTDGESIGFIYPVYAWGPPKMVLDFIGNLKLNNYKHNYMFTVITCGDNIGNAVKQLSSALEKKGLKLHSGFSLKMPNNYIVSFNIDSEEVQNRKFQEAGERLRYISKIIKDRQKGVFELTKGAIPFIYTSIVNPLFNKGALNTKKFYVTDKCTGCGICERICNAQTIKVEGKPKWGTQCTLCLACLHCCPEKAIQYGKSTEKKERYKNPYVQLNEMFINKAQKNI